MSPRVRLGPRGFHLLAILAAVLLLPSVADGHALASATAAPVATNAVVPSLMSLLTISNSTAWTMSSSFWGADVRVYYSLGPTQAATFNASPIEYVRWPGGAVADAYNYTSNRIYAVGGSYYSPPSNESQFVAWCRLVGCHAILQLPAEINDAATAAFYVRYTVMTLHFRPSYWEIGNEPALWNHYGYSWARWLGSQNVNATPGAYATTVQAYALAIRSVDPTAKIIGLPGVGTGGYNEDTWIRATVRLNGPNLSAVAIHVYPAAAANATTPVTLSAFYGFLESKSSLSYRVPRDRSAILAGCSSCTRIALFATELGSGTGGGTFASFMAGFPVVPFIAAEVAQAISGQVPNIDLFALQSNYDGSLLDMSGSPSAVGILYTQMLVHQQSVILNYTLSATPGLLYLVPARNPSGSVYSLLVVNANATHAVRIAFGGTSFPINDPGAAWLWTGASAAPIGTSWLQGHGPGSLFLPARSVLVVQVS